ncbi:MAG: type II secretion system protein [Phycisphaeraceae bacterium]|nr:type II secretion system protein [Phycisphaeraceae bacterium]
MRTRRGMTLIELAVAMGVASTMVGISTSVVLGVRASSRRTVCLAQQRALHLGMAQYTISNRSNLPGVNREGLRFMGALANREAMLGNTTPSTPVSTFDWMSPCLGEELGLSANRARRTAQLFDWLACPDADDGCDALYERPYPPGDAEDFRAIQELEGFRQISYLSPAAFHLRGPWWKPTQYVTYRWRGPAVVPERYKPMTTEVGNPAGKVFVADGTRYLTRTGVLDFDINPVPKYFGSFTTSGPIYAASTAYGSQPNRPQFADETRGAVHEDNWKLSYRHRGVINVMFFDGSSRALDRKTANTDATLWYPAGSEFTGVSATVEASAHHAEGEILY